MIIIIIIIIIIVIVFIVIIIIIIIIIIYLFIYLVFCQIRACNHLTLELLVRIVFRFLLERPK